MSMSKKDFEAVAAVLRRHAEQPDEAVRAALYTLADDLADCFAEACPTFNHECFERAVRGEA